MSLVTSFKTFDVSGGSSYLSASVARKIVTAFREGEKHTSSDEEIENETLGLTEREREREILNALSFGFPYEKIGDELDISIHTVNSHIRKIYEKLRVNSRGEAVAKTRKYNAGI